MMGRQSRQMAMIFVDIESLIPETHLLRKIDMFKMLLIGYLYGIKSERRLVEEVQLNIAYRWF